MVKVVTRVRRILAKPWMLYVFVIGILLSETAAMSFLKEYSSGGEFLMLIVGLAFYFLVCLFLVQSMHYDSIGIVNVLWSAASVLVVLFVGIILFHEQVTGFQMIGIGLVICGVITIRWNEDKKHIPAAFRKK